MSAVFGDSLLLSPETEQSGLCADVAGMAGLEPTISESKSGVLPLHYIPPSKLCAKRPVSRPLVRVGWEMGLEPTTPGTTIRCSYQLSYTHHSWSLALARQEGLEPPAYCLEGSCSILLSYWRLFSRQLAPAPGFPRTRPQAQLYYHPRSHLSSVPRAFPHVISIFYLTRSS